MTTIAVSTEKCFLAFTEYYQTIYPKRDLSREEFDELFSPILNNTNTCFSKLKKEGEKVDIYEAFVSMTVFSEGDFDLKLHGLFRSFDVDNGGSIDRTELLNFLQAAISGLCKLLELPVPS